MEEYLRVFHTHFYFIDTSVLLENAPLVKIHKKLLWDPSGIFSISSLSSAFPWLFMQTVSEKW